MELLNSFVAKTLPFIPKPIVGKVSSRYIAGSRLADAVAVVQKLNAQNMMATLDILGEDVLERGKAESIRNEWIRVLDEIRERRLDSNISVKLSQVGFRIDPDFCYGILRSIVRAAHERGNFVRIDMEDSTMTTATLAQYRKLRAEGFENVGVVIQAYLRRSDADVRDLVKMKANVRLCKGIYRESPDIAYQDRDEIRRSFGLLMRVLIENGCYVGIATHDDYLIDKAYELIQKNNPDRNRYEFQMLLGVREQLRSSIVAAGHRLRVYVPYGDQWYSYSVRRLKENPQIAGYVLRALFTGNNT
ncbi:MAG: proline dehydrogenase [Bacteroidia bacterium]|nr:MAG: proline dehydrogenase [Bacteroidia bacterium]